MECFDLLKKTTKIAYLSSGSTSLRIALFKQKISLPGSIMWDGKYLAVTDSAFNDTQSTGIYQVSPSTSGGVLAKVGGAALQDACAGGNNVCEYRFDTWPYPAGGDDSSHFKGSPYSYGQAVTILN